MKNKGFIVVADHYKANPEKAEATDLHVEDLEQGRIAPDDDTTSIVRIWVREPDVCLEFSRSEAKDLMTAMGIIVDRYEMTPEQWEAEKA